ncbi:MAG TPA: hypothetical protein VM889_12315 [Candidatus Thermoplasmatota archaeon]|nr:hypothetical protein [Candidatus Thermoplasmatota archaeon]
MRTPMKLAMSLLIVAALAAGTVLASGPAFPATEGAKWRACVAEKGKQACRAAWDRHAAMEAKWEACVAEKGEEACKAAWRESQAKA